jgi:hypothetical protein
LPSLSFEGYFNPTKPLPNTWKQLYAATAALLDPKSSKFRFKATQILFSICRESDPLKSAYALKALCSIPADEHLYDFLELERLEEDSGSTYMLLERIFFNSDRILPSRIATLASHFSDASMLYLILENEFSQDASERDSIADGTMLRITHKFIDALGGPEKAFSALLEQFELTKLFKNTRMSFIDKLVQLAKTRNNANVTEIIRVTCILLLHLAGFGDRIISDLIGEDDSSIYETTLVRTVKANSLPGAAKRKLFMLLNDSKQSAHTRLQAAWILHLMGSNVKAMELSKRGIDGYPKPWNQVFPLPTDVRQRILAFYKPSLLPQTNSALGLEAHSIDLEPYEDYERIQPTTVKFDGLEILGPFTAGELHDAGWGTYNAYKIYIDHSGNLIPLGGTSGKHASVAVLLTWSCGPYACIRRNDMIFRERSISASFYVGKEYSNTLKNDSKELPTWEAADQVLRKFAAQYGWTILEGHVLDQQFQGLYVDYFGSREVTVRDLIFNWQD